MFCKWYAHGYNILVYFYFEEKVLDKGDVKISQEDPSIIKLKRREHKVTSLTHLNTKLD